MTTFRSNDPEGPNSPHWIGPEHEPGQEVRTAIENLTQIMAYVENRGEPIWMPEEFDEEEGVDRVHFAADALVRHIQNKSGKGRSTQNRAFFAGLKRAKQEKKPLLERAKSDLVSTQSVLNSGEPIDNLRTQFKTGGRAAEAVIDFLMSAAWFKETDRSGEDVVEPKFREMAVDEALNEFGILLEQPTERTNPVLNKLLSLTNRNANRRHLLFKSQLSTLDSKTKPSRTAKGQEKGTINDPYVKGKRYLDDMGQR